MLFLISFFIFLSLCVPICFGYFSILEGCALSVIFFILYIWNKFYNQENFFFSSFFSSRLFRYTMTQKGLKRFRRSILKEIKPLREYKIFILNKDLDIEIYSKNQCIINKKSRPILEKIIEESHNRFSYINSALLFGPNDYYSKFKCLAYSYHIPFFNKRVLILMYFSPYNVLNSLLQNNLRVVNDVTAIICFFNGFSPKNQGMSGFLDEVLWESPYAVAICESTGDLAFGNRSLYQMFQGVIPNFSELIGKEVFVLILDGKRIGQTFSLQGKRIQCEGFPLNNKNFLITKCILVFFDDQIESKREMLGESNTLRRFTSGSSVVGAAMFTLEGIILYSNEAFMKNLDVYKVREANQKDIFELFELSEEKFQSIVEKILKGEKYKTFLTAVENQQEFQILFKGLIFGDKTIVEVVLEEDSMYTKNLSYLDKETQSLYEELQTARSVQEHILSLPSIYRPGVAIDTLYKPSRQLSGDFFTVIPFDNEQMGFLIADVSGHGVSASLITAALKILIEFAPKESNNLPKIIDYFNTYLAGILPEGSFVTLFYGIINFQDYTFRYINCGHPFPILEDLEKEETKILEGMGYPLGGLLNISFEELVYTIQLPQKCKLFFYTDGILQHLSGPMKEKLDKICKIIQKNKIINDKNLLQTVYNYLVSRHMPIPEDDVSMMLISLDRTRRKKHHLYISSTLLDIDTVISEIGTYIQKELFLDDSMYWKFYTCFHEALLNAVVHGNKYNTQRKVYVEFRISDSLIVLKVRDEGPGFDYHNVSDPLHPDNLLKDFGRGLAMIRAIADKVKFNQKGNEMTIFLYIKGNNQ